jgi:ADP-ribose pyrophosphatase
MSVKRHDLVLDNTVAFDNFVVEEVHIDGNPEIGYQIARRKHCVIMLPVVSDGFVMINEFRIALNKNILQFPAGKIEINETPADAAKRELKEETGYEFTKLEYMGDFYSAPQFSDEKFYAFWGMAEKVGNKLLTAREEIEVTYVTFDKALWAFGNNIIKDAKSIVAFDMWRNRCGTI